MSESAEWPIPGAGKNTAVEVTCPQAKASQNKRERTEF